MTKSIREELKKLNCTSSYIPGGCTGFLQVLDISLNKLLKEMIAQATEDHYDKYTTWYKEGKFIVAERRVLLTKQVATAQKRLYKEKKDLIIKTFRLVGLSLNPDSSKDHEIKIKGLDNIIIRDYSRAKTDSDNGLRSLLPTDIQSINNVKAKLAARVKAKRVKHQTKLVVTTTRVADFSIFPEYQQEGDNCQSSATNSSRR